MARVSKPGAEALCLLSVFLGLCVGVCPFSATLCVCVVEPTSPGSQSVHVHNQTTQRFSLECLVSFFPSLLSCLSVSFSILAAGKNNSTTWESIEREGVKVGSTTELQRAGGCGGGALRPLGWV